MIYPDYENELVVPEETKVTRSHSQPSTPHPRHKVVKMGWEDGDKLSVTPHQTLRQCHSASGRLWPRKEEEKAPASLERPTLEMDEEEGEPSKLCRAKSERKHKKP